MKKLFKLLFLIILCSNYSFAQIDVDQNGLKSTVTNGFSASGTQARRFEIARVGYNSHHWQGGGIIVVELFETKYATGYEKYFVQIGYGEGTGTTSPIAYLVESRGSNHNAKVSLGNSEDLSTSSGGYVNKVIPILVDVRYYATYKAKITYLRNKVTEVTKENQIQVIESPSPQNIADFSVSTVLKNNINTSGNLRISGNGVHYISNGNLLIGKVAQQNSGYKLDVDGSIRANEIKINLGGADFVFESDYKLRSLEEVESYIKENKRLPEMASANEMSKEGANLGELNNKLLQKIEELTLYVIDLHKQIEDLKSQQNKHQ